ncbi:hypothetical protein MKW94_030966 [Papaver nudicaule]|uniref:Uncharacterized protein n=1 Tax=Papaver nudicaule TaxID=74823 RepID=A0AA42B1I9_PAPNU|nr:hypothetical protein [Papaver nudicaule]
MGIAEEYRFLTFLMVCSLLLSVSILGALCFVNALSIVGSHDPLLKHSLVVLHWVVKASSTCNFLGMSIALILSSSREYLLYQKFSLLIGTTASFLFMVLGYGLLLSFIVQHP